MTLGEKLSKLRKEYNYTQEQLADIIGVTRQSISKWESDIAYPETDKLIKIGKLFECSMDYLFNEDITEKQELEPDQKESFGDKFKNQLYEHDSAKRVFGNMKKENIYKFLFTVSAFLFLGFVIRVSVDIFKYNSYQGAVQRYAYAIVRSVEFIVSSIIVFIVGIIVKKKISK